MWTLEKQRAANSKSYFKMRAEKPEKYAARLERSRISEKERRASDPDRYRLRAKEWRKKNPSSVRISSRLAHAKWYLDQENKNKRRVERLFRRNQGRLGIVRPEKCSICGEVAETIAHHSDYDKPFDVIWMCRHCHSVWHRNRGTP